MEDAADILEITTWALEFEGYFYHYLRALFIYMHTYIHK